MNGEGEDGQRPTPRHRLKSTVAEALNAATLSMPVPSPNHIRDTDIHRCCSNYFHDNDLHYRRNTKCSACEQAVPFGITKTEADAIEILQEVVDEQFQAASCWGLIPSMN